MVDDSVEVESVELSVEDELVELSVLDELDELSVLDELVELWVLSVLVDDSVDSVVIVTVELGIVVVSPQSAGGHSLPGGSTQSGYRKVLQSSAPVQVTLHTEIRDRSTSSVTFLKAF